MRRFSGLFVPATCCALALAGCTSSPTGGNSSWFSNPFSTASKPTPLPAVKTGPSGFEKFNNSVAAVPRAIGNSVVKGTTTVGHWIVPQSHPAANGSLAAPAVAAVSPDTPKIGPDLYVASARLYERNGNFIGAADQYQKALKVAPDNLVALLSYAHLLDRQEKLDQATQLYQRAVKAHPHEASAHNDLGLCYARRRMLNESVASLSEAARLQPQRELYRGNLATVLIEQNRADEALKQLQAVQADAVAHYNVGYLLQQRGQDQLAANYFNRAAQLDPSFTAARDWSMRMAARTQKASEGDSIASMAAMPKGNGYLSGNHYSAQQTSGMMPAASDMPSGEMQSLPPLQ